MFKRGLGMMNLPKLQPYVLRFCTYLSPVGTLVIGEDDAGITLTFQIDTVFLCLLNAICKVVYVILCLRYRKLKL